VVPTTREPIYTGWPGATGRRLARAS
jgi:hypothetical protein